MPSAAILAGGRARRFAGRDKSALVVDGRSILARQLAELAPVADDIMLVGRDRQPPIGEVRAVPDRVPDCGPLGGLDTALAAARHDVVLVVACDMPFISTPVLRCLAALAGGVDAVVPRTERGFHPLCAAYRRACLPIVARRLANRQLKLIELLEELRVRTVTATELAEVDPDLRFLVNVNTAAEHEEATGALHGHEL